MNPIRFRSILNPDKWGFEFTNDTTKLFDQCYRTGNVLNDCFAYYGTLGDGTTQHTPLMPCTLEHFTDYCLSLVKYCLANPQEELKTYSFGLEPCPVETVKFLAGIIYRDDKRQWFTIGDGCKLSTSQSKENDRRYFRVPADADGTVCSAVNLFYQTQPDRRRQWFEVYALLAWFEGTLYSTHARGGEAWEKKIKFMEQMPGDHQAAFRAVENLVRGRALLEFAGRAAECAESNSRRSMEAKEVAA